MNQFKQKFVSSNARMEMSWSVVLGLLIVALVTLGCASATPTTPPVAAPTNVPAPTNASAPTTAPVAAPTNAAPAATNAAPAATNAAPTTAAPAPTTAAPAPTTAAPAQTTAPAAPISDGTHTLLRPDMKLRKVATVGANNIKLARNPKDGDLYYLNGTDGVYHVDLTTGDTKRIITMTDVVTYGLGAGMAFEHDGTLLIVFNQPVPLAKTQAVVRRGTPDASGKYTWDTLVQTEPYPMAGNNFDHLYNGIVVSPDGKYVFLNAGSRSDHGEIEDNFRNFPNTREVPLTSAMFRVPAGSKDLILPNDETALKPYLFADGTRNEFDPEFAPNGDLIAGDNGPDADYPDELNWIREGHHYGFPWKFGTQDNPQQFPDYTELGDNHLQKGFFAVDNGFYRNDPTFPPPPAGVTFTDPIVNLGPDADHYRADDGSEHDSSDENKPISTFTPHISPLGLVFVTGNAMPADLRSTDSTISAFITSWGAAAGTLKDRGSYLLHLQLTKKGDNYEMTTTDVATGFNYPIDGVLIDNRYYMLEWGEQGAIWDISFGDGAASGAAPTATTAASASAAAMALTSTSFADGAKIPDQYTHNGGADCSGQDISPALAWSGAPQGTKSFAVSLIDPDAQDWVHWVQFNIPPDTTALPEAKHAPDIGIRGRTSFGVSEYDGPCPPSGDHHYTFTVYALDTMLTLDNTATWSEVNAAMKGHILGQAQLIGMRGK